MIRRSRRAGASSLQNNTPAKTTSPAQATMKAAITSPSAACEASLESYPSALTSERPSLSQPEYGKLNRRISPLCWRTQALK